MLRSTTAMISRPPRFGWGVVLGGGVLLLVCAALLALTQGVAPEVRRTALHLTLLVAVSAFAILPPHLLFPEPDAAWLRIVNAPPRALLLRAARRWSGALGLTLAALATVALGGGLTAAPWADLLAHGGAALGAWSFALHDYARLGAVSQGYQEGTQGDWLRRAMSHTSAGRLEIPYGLAPSLIATVRVFLVGAAMMVMLAYAGQAAGAYAAFGVGLIASAIGVGLLLRAAPHFDRAYYHTDALYREVLHVTPLDADAREPIAYDAAYWVPHAFRPLAWASLRQMDRRLPLGRLVALLHAALWLVVLRTDAGTGATALAVALGAVVMVPLLAGALGQGSEAWPTAWSMWLAPPRAWTWARGFVALRWLAPLAASLAGLVLFADRLTPLAALGWAVAFVALAFLFAALTTLRQTHAARLG